MFPYWLNGPPWMFSRVGYFWPGWNPTGRMIHASTSVPSSDTATNRSGSDSSLDEANRSPTLVTWRSPSNSSDSRVAVVSECAMRPPAMSNPVTQRSPPTTTSGSSDPSAAAR